MRLAVLTNINQVEENHKLTKQMLSTILISTQ